jgi:hypothetical protein
MPPTLATRVHRMEEQGIDYSATGTSTFELTLAVDGTGHAVRSSQGVDVLGSDAHVTDETVRYGARARWSGERLLVALTPADGSPATALPIEIACERWTETMRADSSEVRDASLPGVEWVCALPENALFGLGLVVVQHVPRVGGFLLLGSRELLVDENVSGQGGRSVSTRIGNTTTAETQPRPE